MSRKLILWIAALALIGVMAGATMHEALEHRHAPFPTDGDFGTLAVAATVGLCAGVAAATVPFLGLMFALACALICYFERRSVRLRDLHSYQRLLFSPPRSPFSLRI